MGTSAHTQLVPKITHEWAGATQKLRRSNALHTFADNQREHCEELELLSAEILEPCMEGDYRRIRRMCRRNDHGAELLDVYDCGRWHHVHRELAEKEPDLVADVNDGKQQRDSEEGDIRDEQALHPWELLVAIHVVGREGISCYVPRL